MKPIFIQATEQMSNFEKPIPAPCFRRVFRLDFLPETSRLTICGLGFYRLFINGQEITKGFLAPYISNPDQFVCWDTYDLADLLCCGDNCIGVILGNGLNNNFGGKVWRFDQGPWVGPPKLAMEMEAEGQGKRFSLTADSQFRVHPSPIVFDDYRMGEWYDAQKEIPGWNLPGFDDQDWETAMEAPPPLGEMIPCSAAPIRVQRILEPVAIWPEGDGWVYDFGENNAGVTKLRILAKPGQKITIRHGEFLHNGKFTIKNIIVEKPTVTFYPEYAHKTVYTARGGGWEEYMPSFAYYGFRYAYVEGITPEQATEDLLRFVVIHSDLRRIGGFSCSEEDVNRLIEMVERSDLSNFYYFPTDCPHREKNGWTGDARISAAHLLDLFDAESSYALWLRSLRYSQRENGKLPGIVPTAGWGYDWGCGPAWDCALFELPYQLFRIKGNAEVIRENVDAMVKYLHYIMGRRREDGTICVGLGDWAPVGKYANEYDTPESVTDTITILDAARKAEQMFRAIDRPELAEWAGEIAEELYQTVRRELLETGSGIMKCPTQTAQAMALYYHVVEEQEREASFAELLRRIGEKEGHFDGGMLELHVLFHVLAEFDRVDMAYEMIMGPDFPSYGYLIRQGESTLPEAFLQADDDKHLVFSHNHHIFGDVARFFVEDVAGLIVTGRQSVCIEPHYVEALAWAQSWHELDAGRVTVRWERSADNIQLTVICPKEVHCEVRCCEKENVQVIVKEC